MKLEVDIEKSFPDFKLKVAFSVGKDTMGILGSSGAGKSMTLRCIAGLERPSCGYIALNDRVLFDSQKNINVPSRNRKISLLFQHYALFPHMTVRENVEFGLQGLPENEKKARVSEKLSMVELTGFEYRYPHQLSGGQKQRVALARALAGNPDALLLDEPFSALDSYLRNNMEKQLIKSLSEYHGVSIVVTHNLEEAYSICHNLVILDRGKKITEGYKENVFQYPPTLAAAQLTGCKNLSKAKKAGENAIEAIEWGCILKTRQAMPEGLSYVGIRSHHLDFLKDNSRENTFLCHVIKTKEMQHITTVYIEIDKNCLSRQLLQVELLKEKWDRIKDSSSPLFIHLDPEKLFLTCE